MKNNGSLITARHSVITRREKAAGTLAAVSLAEAGCAEPVRGGGHWRDPLFRALNRAAANAEQANVQARVASAQQRAFIADLKAGKVDLTKYGVRKP